MNYNEFREKVKDGDKIKCKIDLIKIEGVITIENGEIFICQNKICGKNCEDKKGYEYSWFINENGFVYLSDILLDNIHYVYVSDYSIEDALKYKEKRILISTLPGNIYGKYICVEGGYEDDYINLKRYKLNYWRYIAEIPEEEKKKVTLELTDEQLEQLKKQFNI